MQHDDDPGRRFARWWTPCFVVVWLTTMATFACAYFFGFNYAKPMAFIAGAMIVAMVVAGFVLAPRRYEAHELEYDLDSWRSDVNPATGLPMAKGSMIDIGGNGYGQRHHPAPDFRASDD